MIVNKKEENKLPPGVKRSRFVTIFFLELEQGGEAITVSNNGWEDMVHPEKIVHAFEFIKTNINANATRIPNMLQPPPPPAPEPPKTPGLKLN